MRIRIIFSILLISSLILSGCYDKFEVNQTVAVVAHGWDIEGPNKLIFAQLALTPPREGQLATEPKFLVVSASAPSFVQAGRRLSLTLPRKPLWSMANTAIIGEKLARKDISLFADTATRNPRIRYNVLLFLSKGVTPEDVLNIEVPPENYSGTALEKIIQNQTGQAGIYIPITMKDFLNRSAAPGIEPVIPQIVIEENKDQKQLTLQGMAVFKGRKMIGSLDEQQTRGLALLKTDAIKKTIFNINSPLGSQENEEMNTPDILALELTAYQTRINPIINGENIIMEIEIEAEGNIIEDNNTRELGTPETLRKVEQAASQDLIMKVQGCIDQAQALDSDILGWGQIISRSYPQTWQNIESSWPEMFAGIKYDIQIDYKLRRTYLEKDVFKFK